MSRMIRYLLCAGLIGLAAPAAAQSRGEHEVVGVEGEDMLKMRSGPGLNYRVIVGLPNGAVVRVKSCQPAGHTSWCEVVFKGAFGLRGYVSGAYLRKR